MRIIKLHIYENIPGVCIILDYLVESGSRVGVTMDIVLAQTQKCELMGKISNKCKDYLEDLDLYLENDQNVYKLLGKDQFDTGILENALLDKQPEKKPNEDIE